MAELFYRGEDFNSNFFYRTGLDIDHAFFLTHPRVLFVPRLNYTLAKKLFPGRIIAYTDISKALKPFIQRRKLFVDARSLPLSVYFKLSKFAKLVDSSEGFLKARAKKSAEELTTISQAVRCTKKIFSEVEERLDRFKREEDLRKFILTSTIELGLEKAFEPIVASGANTRFPHYQSGSNAKLNKLVLIDYGVRYKHYCSDLTRCFFIERNHELEGNYELLQQIFFEILEQLPNFSTGKELALFAEKLYAKNKFAFPPHSMGHGVGLDVHELPRLSKRFSDKLAGAVFALEPSVYFKSYGLRFEDNIYFNGRKARIL